jgi:hypothetical protein
MTGILSPSRILGVALSLGVAVDVLFYGHALGISFPIFVLLVLVALLALGWMEGVRPSLRNLWLVLPLLFFAGMVAFRTNPLVTTLNVCASLVLLGVLAYFFSAGRVDRLGVFGYLIVLLLSFINSLSRTGPMLSVTVNKESIRKHTSSRLLPFLRGILIAIPILIIFAALLASADSVFQGILTNVLQIQIFENLPELMWRIIIILSAAWVVAGVLFYALSRRAEPDADKDPDDITPPFHIGFIESFTVMLLVDLLFASFAWVQFAYLFGTAQWAARGPWDYREYARHGFGELLFTSVLSLVLILALHHMTWRETGRQTIIFNILSTLMIGLVLVMVASAWQRMIYWEQVEAYMFTQTRIYVRIFIVWLALVFGWLSVTVWHLHKRFGIGAFVAVLGFLITLNVINPDDNVARYNLADYSRTGVIDGNYLNVLSEDAVPATIEAFRAAPPEGRRVLGYYLQERLNEMEADHSWRDWPSFNFARQEAYRLLIANRDQITASRGTNNAP